MNLKIQTPEDAIRKNKELNTFSPKEDYIKTFKKELKTLYDKIAIINERKVDETEEHLKTDVRDFLIHSVYARDEYAINTKGKIDLAIYLGKDTNANVGVIIEAKRPKNKGEMISAIDVNKKALHEILLYSFREKANNPDLKYIIITNVVDWYLININDFENKHIFNNSRLIREFNKIEEEGKTNPHYYEEVRNIIPTIDYELPCIHFNLNDYNDLGDTQKDQKKLINLYKLLSPDFLLKKPLANDSNKLNTKFYNELLHIIGIEPINEGGKIVIKRKAKPDDGSFLENTINILVTDDVLRKVANTAIYGNTNEDKLYNIALELVLTWTNRVLFLKLLEGQLKSYNKDNPDEHKFLNPDKIKDFDELYKLFHQVLARNYDDRSDTIKKEYNLVPYLNSSLFEITELENIAIKINSLDDNLTIPVFNKTVIKTDKNKINPLKYLLEFLNAYDFGSEKDETIASEKLINASVLGLIFEKINGYKDGSFYTPGFITQYMCKETIERAVIQKFNEAKGWDCKNLTDLHNKEIDNNLKESNAIIDSVKICDPAVGSGHFLVSALNQMIAIKHELNILVEDRTADSWKKLRNVDIQIINDELSIQVDNENFKYNPKDPRGQIIQKALFEEKQLIIENCLFGVDINPNSVKICRLRLWIELLKNAYYKEITLANSEKIKVLETLPNIDINIKCGNSLISRFTLDADLKEALKKSKLKIEDYKRAVDQYRNAESKEQKRDMETLIAEIKTNFRTEINQNGKELKELQKLKYEFNVKFDSAQLFETKLTKAEQKVKKDLTDKIDKIETQLEELKSNKIYENAFEWRFEFPEVLNDQGDFVGFDVVIGNPPYVLSRETFDENNRNYFSKNFSLIHEKPNLYLLFIEKSLHLLCPKAELSFIIPNSITGMESAFKIRERIINNYRINAIINILGESFENVGVETCIILLSNKTPSEKVSYININNNLIEKNNFNEIDIIQWKNNRNYLFDISSSSKDFPIINKLKSKSIQLSEMYDVKVGLQAYEKGKGKPQQTESDVKNHIYDYNYEFDKDTYPYLNGSDIGRYKLNWSGQWLRHGDWLSQPKNIGQFNCKRILIREITGSFPYIIQAMFVEKTYLNNKSIINILEKREDYSLKFLVSYLNCKLIGFYHKRQTVKGNRSLFPKVVIKDLQNYPIPNISTLDQQPFIDKVDQILSLKKDNPAADTNALEREIDMMVYELYGLTEEEIAIVENN